MTVMIAYDPDYELIYSVLHSPKGGRSDEKLRKDVDDGVKHLTSKGYRVKVIIIHGDEVMVEQ